MPTYVLLGWDKPGGLELRMQHRPAHLEKLQPLDQAGRIRYGGPLLDDEGKPMGSVVVFDADSMADAQAIVERDPYVIEGVFERYELRETKVVFPI